MDEEGSRAKESGPRRPPWKAFRAALDAADFHPTKARGQNFLLDGNMAASIVRDARILPGERILEIGSGCGFLTMHLAAAGADLLAVEVDPRLVQVASGLIGDEPNVELVEMDVLAGKHALSAALSERLPTGPHGLPWSVVSNLPYSISGPLLALLARWEPAPRRVTALVQDEMAHRVAAEPGSSNWGALSARLALTHSAVLGRTVSRDLFWPRPKVSSRVVHLDVHPRPDPGPDGDAESPPGVDREAYDALVGGLFQRRRKTLGSALAGLLKNSNGTLGPRIAAGSGRTEAVQFLSGEGLDPLQRPGDLDPAALVVLSSALVRARARA